MRASKSKGQALIDSRIVQTRHMCEHDGNMRAKILYQDLLYERSSQAKALLMSKRSAHHVDGLATDLGDRSACIDKGLE